MRGIYGVGGGFGGEQRARLLVQCVSQVIWTWSPYSYLASSSPLTCAYSFEQKHIFISISQGWGLGLFLKCDPK